MTERLAPQLAFDDISLRFEETTVLKHISFELAGGETLVVLGAAGSGKTMLLKIALGLLRPSEGRLIVFGEDVTSYSERQWFDVRSRIGVLFQEGGLFDSLNIADNVAYPLENQPLLKCLPDQVRPKVEQSLEFVGLAQTLEKYPSELSGGMRRRAGIARAIVTLPELLLYDSPTAGLDPITANMIVALIAKGRDVRQTATVMVTQRYQDGEIMARFRYDAGAGELRPVQGNGDSTRTRYLVLEEGRIVFLGTPQELEACTDPYVVKFIPHG
jgi:phospholipid/cholesterol/gamma-HCH transport system ATP-binding protein